MKDNESRKSRKQAENNRKIKDDSSGGISKVYYWAIGILFVILIGLTIFIFARSGEDINLEDENDQTEKTQEQQTADDPENTEDSGETDTAETNEPTDTTEEETDEPDEDSETTVNEDAPLDESYEVTYADGSNDRIAIKNQVMQVTGLDSNLIEWWVGNNGPGQVETTVSNRDQSEVYRVYLQYGEGSWHVTNFESLPEVPANLR